MSQTGVQAEVRICTDAEDMAAKVAEVIVRQATCCAGQMGRFTLALSGGRTPETLFEVLARDFAMKLPWQKTHFFWGDDRFVPHEDPRSNYRLA
ncbi:MAG: 6-phosphogluconolactonase, partial [Acidobacteriales bacterium]|nr:6-phosphogluconolactonase [Terriglobales bacterium]